MAGSRPHKRGTKIERPVLLVDALLRGQALGRMEAAELLGVEPAAAYKQLQQLTKIPCFVKRGRRFVFDRSRLGDKVTLRAAVAACIMAGVGRLFRGTNYDVGMVEAKDHVLRWFARELPYRELHRKFLFAVSGGEASLPDASGTLDDLLDGILEQKRVRFTYQRFDGEESRVTGDPLSLVIYDHQLYVLLRTPEGAFRTHRFSRMSDFVVTAVKFTYPTKSEYDPDQMVGGSFGIFTGSAEELCQVEILLDIKWKTFALTHKWHPTQRTVVDGDAVRVTFDLRPCPELRAWILGFGPEALVVGPESLRHEIASAARMTAERYTGTSDESSPSAPAIH